MKSENLQEQLKCFLLTYGRGKMKTVVETLTQWLIKPPQKLPISIKCSDKMVAQSLNDLFKAQNILAEIIPFNEKPRYKVYTEIDIPPLHERLIDLPLVIEHVVSWSRHDNTPDIYIELSKYHLALFFFLCYKYASAAGLETPIYDFYNVRKTLYWFTKRQYFRFSPNRLIRLGGNWRGFSDRKAVAFEILKMLDMPYKYHSIEGEYFLRLPEDYYIEDVDLTEILRKRQHGLLPKSISNPIFGPGPSITIPLLTVISGDFRHFLRPDRSYSEWLKEFKSNSLLQKWADHTFELGKLQDEFIKLLSSDPFKSVINQDDIENLKPINKIYEKSIKAEMDLLNLGSLTQDELVRYNYDRLYFDDDKGHFWPKPPSPIKPKKQNENSSHTPVFSHTPDYRCVKISNQEFTLTSQQAQVIQILDEHRLSGVPDVSKDYIINEVAGPESSHRKLSEVFRDKDARKALIAPGKRKGTYRLNISQN